MSDKRVAETAWAVFSVFTLDDVSSADTVSVTVIVPESRRDASATRGVEIVRSGVSKPFCTRLGLKLCAIDVVPISDAKQQAAVKMTAIP